MTIVHRRLSSKKDLWRLPGSALRLVDEVALLAALDAGVFDPLPVEVIKLVRAHLTALACWTCGCSPNAKRLEAVLKRILSAPILRRSGSILG
jgi:hypothetical protein